MTKDETLLTFPCDFQIKIIGNNHENFTAEIIAIAKNHFPQLAEDRIKKQPSEQGTYISISITVFAESKAGLDALYQALTAHPHTKWVL